MKEVQKPFIIIFALLLFAVSCHNKKTKQINVTSFIIDEGLPKNFNFDLSYDVTVGSCDSEIDLDTFCKYVNCNGSRDFYIKFTCDTKGQIDIEINNKHALEEITIDYSIEDELSVTNRSVLIFREVRRNLINVDSTAVRKPEFSRVKSLPLKDINSISLREY